MDFHEWMTVSEKVIGEDGMAAFEQFVLGNISFEDCLKQMYEATPQENMAALKAFMNSV
jgi:hypothetical protein